MYAIEVPHKNGPWEAVFCKTEALAKEVVEAESRVRVLEEALRQLRNEISGVLGIEEVAIRALIGNTNMNVLRLRILEADKALAPPAGTPHNRVNCSNLCQCHPAGTPQEKP